jgi:hypothetical protein
MLHPPTAKHMGSTSSVRKGNHRPPSPKPFHRWESSSGGLSLFQEQDQGLNRSHLGQMMCSLCLEGNHGQSGQTFVAECDFH